MALSKTQSHTVETFERFCALPENHDRSFELIDGEIVEKTMPTDEHSLIAGLIIHYLASYCLEHGLGLPGPERRFSVPGDYKNARMPDVSVILDPDVPITTKGPMSQVPDIVVEVKSPDDSNDDLRDRMRFYSANGARLGWLIFPREKIIEVYRPDVPSEMLTLTDSLDGFDVLPGFSLPVATLLISKRSG